MSTETCPVTVYRYGPSPTPGNHHGLIESACGEPLAVDARFCERHEADRIRLGGAA